MQCVHTHVTRSQLQLKQARCKISNKGYLSLNIFVILCHNMVIRSGDITTIPKGLSVTLFGRFQQTISCDCVCVKFWIIQQIQTEAV